MTIYKDQLEAVYRLIEKPENWLQGDFAKNQFGEIVASDSNEACQWCLLGAFEHVLKADEIGDAYSFFPDENGFTGSFMVFNDTHTHAEVLALLKSAIDRAPERP